MGETGSWPAVSVPANFRDTPAQLPQGSRAATAGIRRIGLPVQVSLLWTTLVCGSHHLFSQAGWNRCKLTLFYSVPMRATSCSI